MDHSLLTRTILTVGGAFTDLSAAREICEREADVSPPGGSSVCWRQRQTEEEQHSGLHVGPLRVKSFKSNDNVTIPP